MKLLKNDDAIMTDLQNGRLDGSMISIYCPAVEDEVAENMHQRSELDWLIYNDPAAYADLILSGDPETYLKSVTEYKRPDQLKNRQC